MAEQIASCSWMAVHIVHRAVYQQRSTPALLEDYATSRQPALAPQTHPLFKPVYPPAPHAARHTPTPLYRSIEYPGRGHDLADLEGQGATVRSV